MPPKFRKLHEIVNKHMESLSHVPEFLRPDHDVAVYYLWNFNSPLRLYMTEDSKTSNRSVFFKQWASMAPLYAAYGRRLIEDHPASFIKYYVWPNFIQYYAPPMGFLRYYNLERDTVDHIAVSWFGWKKNKVNTYFENKQIQITTPFPILLAIINLVFILAFLSFVILNGFGKCATYTKRILLWTAIIWISNMVFSVLAAPIELRYQLFPMTVTFIFLGLLLSFVVEESKSAKTRLGPYYDFEENSQKINIPLV